MYQPFLNSAKASLDYLDSDALKDLMNDDEKLDERVTEAVSSLENEKETIITENRALAEENLEKEPVMIETRGRVMDLSEQGKSLCLKVQEKLTEMKSKSGNLNQDTALALLQTAGAEMEEESESLVKQFLESELTVDAFLEQFQQQRKLMHLRKLKAEKMTEIIKQPQTRGPPQFSGYPGSGFYPSPHTHQQNMPPYPMGPIAMPMPGMYRPY